MVTSRASIFQTPREREVLIRALRCPYFKWKDEYTSELYQFSRSPQWWRKDKTAYAFDMFLRAGCLEYPALFPALWRMRVRAQFRILAKCAAEGAPPHYKGMVRLLLAPYFNQRSPYTYFHWLLNNASPFHFHEATDVSGQMWRDTLDVVVDAADWRSLSMYSVETFLRNIDKGHEGPQHAQSLWNTTDLRDYFKGLLLAKQKAERQKQRQRIHPFKEELMAAAWHPRRVAAALEAGINPEDL